MPTPVVLMCLLNLSNNTQSGFFPRKIQTLQASSFRDTVSELQACYNLQPSYIVESTPTTYLSVQTFNVMRHVSESKLQYYLYKFQYTTTPTLQH